MELTQKQLQEVNELAKLAFTEPEIATILMIDVSQFMAACADKNTAAYKAFNGGFLESEVIFRRKIKNLAELGSAPAQKMLKTIIEESNLKRLMNNYNDQGS